MYERAIAAAGDSFEPGYSDQPGAWAASPGSNVKKGIMTRRQPRQTGCSPFASAVWLNDPQVAFALDDQGWFRYKQGRFAAAEESVRRGRDQRTRAGYAARAMPGPRTSWVSFCWRRDISRIEAHVRRALAIREELQGAGQPFAVAESLHSLAGVLVEAAAWPSRLKR